MTRSMCTIGLVGTLWLVGCQGKQNGSDADAAQTTEPEKTTQVATETRECYAYLSPQDTIRLTLVQNGNAVSGDPLYQLAEKDRNTGTLQGQMQGDTLLATYTFRSEGVQSKREVIFLKGAGGLVEGYGPIEQRGGQPVFNNRSALVFNEKMRLIPTDCQP